MVNEEIESFYRKKLYILEYLKEFMRADILQAQVLSCEVT